MEENRRSSVAERLDYYGLLFVLLLLAIFLFRSELMLQTGIILFAGAVLFQVVTLPVEYNASSRALVLLEEGGYLNRQEVGGAKEVLNAAALTYVAATMAAVLHLVRLLFLASRFSGGKRR
jgi:Zn-dependent membrane protease YugP